MTSTNTLNEATTCETRELSDEATRLSSEADALETAAVRDAEEAIARCTRSHGGVLGTVGSEDQTT